MTNEEYLKEIEKNRVEVVPKESLEDSITKVGGNILDFCKNDKGFKEEYEKSGNKEKYEDVLKKFVDYLFENKGNPRLKLYYIKNPDGTTLQMMDMEDAFNLYKKFVNNDVEALKELDEANKKGKEVSEMVKMYNEHMKKIEEKKTEMRANAVDVKDADLITYHKLILTGEIIERVGLKVGTIFTANDIPLFDKDNNGIYVNGEVELVYVDEKRKMAVTKKVFDLAMQQYKDNREGNVGE